MEAAREGRIGARNNGQGYVFFLTGIASQKDAVDHHRLERRQSEPQVIDADFREVAPNPSTSWALVPRGPAQPYDSRVAAALEQHSRARRSQSTRTITTPSNPFVASLNGLYAADPDGDETLGALARAYERNTAAIRSAQDQASQYHVSEEQQRKAEAANRKAEEKALKEAEELRWALSAISGLNRLERAAIVMAAGLAVTADRVDLLLRPLLQIFLILPNPTTPKHSHWSMRVAAGVRPSWRNGERTSPSRKSAILHTGQPA